jgi:hypothetical protein
VINVSDPLLWFLVLFTFSNLAIAVFLICKYAKKYNEIKEKVHSIIALLQLIDESMEDDTVTKEEFTNIVKRCLSVLSELV